MRFFINPVWATVALLSLAVSTTAYAQATTGANTQKPMYLKTVMTQLNRDMQSVAGAISKEDWAEVAALAPKIASHQQPPMLEKMRILPWLGSNADKFRGFDEQVHRAATEMGEAAKRGDGQATINAFAKTQQSCLACHQNFRKPFVTHFYGK